MKSEVRFSISMDEIKKERAELEERAAAGDEIAQMRIDAQDEGLRKLTEEVDREIVDEILRTYSTVQ